MEQIFEVVEIKSTKYTLLSAEKYAELNHNVSLAMGFNIGEQTERYAPVEPQLAKINIIYDEEGNESFETIPVMQITGFVQENYPDTLVGIDLVESYVPYVPENVQL